MAYDPQETVTFLQNPFAVKSPEELPREMIVRLFVATHTRIEAIKERKHTFVWGSRGSGKSMMLRYLEPQCMAIAHETLEAFLSTDDPFVAVYCPCKEGHLNKTELTLLDEYPRLIVAEHLLNLMVAGNVTRCLKEQFPDALFSNGQGKLFVDRVTALFDKASVAASVSKADAVSERNSEPLAWLEAVFEAELVKVGRFLRDMALTNRAARYDAATTGYHDFLLPFVRAARSLLRDGSAPIFILLDDADHLLPLQQQIVNTWIANRDQRDLCIKVSARREGYHCFQTRDGVEIEEPHDYSTVDVDELYTQSKSDYAEKVALIAARRLFLSQVPTKDIQTFLPPDPTQEKLLSEIKRKTAAEWAKTGKPGRQSDFVTRYATARLFQHLRQTKQRRNYAGFYNIVHLSSGVVRDFLEPCYLMFDKLLDQGEQPEHIEEIPSSAQDAILFQYSEEFFVHRFSNIKQSAAPEDQAKLAALETLVQSLGRLFYERLHDPEAREARLFSFTVRGAVPADLDEVLRLGTQQRYFQLRSYSTKEGGGREKWYILNRRLCPVFKLDPTGFEGRISLTPDLLRLACEDTERFVKLRLKQSNDASTSPTLFSLDDTE